jgi:voltage-gated sodium channel
VLFLFSKTAIMTRLFTNNKFIFSLVVLNAILIFTEGFFQVESLWAKRIEFADNICSLLFTVEAVVKIKFYGKQYFKDKWNVFDFVLVILVLPSLLLWFSPYNLYHLKFLLPLRVLRVFKFFRLIKFVPNIEHIANGVARALKSSIVVVIAFFMLNFILSIISFTFFRDVAPEYFGNPLMAFYTTFKIFTVEGWYEIPDIIAERTNSVLLAVGIKIYFVFLLFGGGIFGLSLINSIFVDSMMSDNNDELIHKLEEIEKKLDALGKSMEEKT